MPYAVRTADLHYSSKHSTNFSDSLCFNVKLKVLQTIPASYDSPGSAAALRVNSSQPVQEKFFLISNTEHHTFRAAAEEMFGLIKYWRLALVTFCAQILFYSLQQTDFLLPFQREINNRSEICIMHAIKSILIHLNI